MGARRLLALGFAAPVHDRCWPTAVIRGAAALCPLRKENRTVVRHGRDSRHSALGSPILFSEFEARNKLPVTPIQGVEIRVGTVNGGCIFDTK
jgi:hypothetical protein